MRCPINLEDESDVKDLERYKPEQWMIDLLDLNPEYVFWGPYEDYMSDKNCGWREAQFCDSWDEFKEGWIPLNHLNECINFYFEIDRKKKDCPHCNGSGYSPRAKKLDDNWYDGDRLVNNLEQPEVDVLWEEGRFRHDFEEKPTAAEVNEWSKKGFGHDAINRWICISNICEREGVSETCDHCEGWAREFTADHCHVNLVLWMIHPRKGCSRGVEVKNIKEEELPEIYEFLANAAERNANRFSKVVKKGS